MIRSGTLLVAANAAAQRSVGALLAAGLFWLLWTTSEVCNFAQTRRANSRTKDACPNISFMLCHPSPSGVHAAPTVPTEWHSSRLSPAHRIMT